MRHITNFYEYTRYQPFIIYYRVWQLWPFSLLFCMHNVDSDTPPPVIPVDTMITIYLNLGWIETIDYGKSAHGFLYSKRLSLSVVLVGYPSIIKIAFTSLCPCSVLTYLSLPWSALFSLQTTLNICMATKRMQKDLHDLQSSCVQDSSNCSNLYLQHPLQLLANWDR